MYKVILPALLAALLIAGRASAEITLTAPSPQVNAGAALNLQLILTNEADQPLVVTLPEVMRLRMETRSALTLLEVRPERSGAIEVAPGGFARINLLGQVPAEISGTVAVTPTGLRATPLILDVAAPVLAPSQAGSAPAEMAAAAVPSGGQAGEAMASLPAQSADPSSATQAASSTWVDKPPPLALSVYEPVYFLIGGDGGLNAKFQISLRYRLFDDQGRLAQRLPWIDDLYLSYSQTSLWDLGELSKPFRDSSYRPRLFYGNYDLLRFNDGQMRLGVEGGFGHESNGKDGAESRSFNMWYLRPTLTVGDPQGLRFFIAPLLHNYVSDDENPDLKDYRGYIDWLVGFGSKGGLDFWATLRKGERSSYGSAELNLSYPLSKLSGGDLTGWLTLQYFGGYGESLLDYNRKIDSQLRLGISVAL